MNRYKDFSENFNGIKAGFRFLGFLPEQELTHNSHL